MSKSGSMQETRVAIIGAGVTGLAISAVLAETVGDVTVIERHEGFGREISAHSGDIIHSGVFYRTGSLKSQLCMEGGPMLYKYLEGNNINHSRPGKYVVATSEDQIPLLETLYKDAQLSGLRKLEYLDGRQVSLQEPEVQCYSAIYCPSAGTVDSHALMKAFYDEAVGKGVKFRMRKEVESVEKDSDGYVISTSGGDQVRARVVINAAGVGAPDIAGLAGIDTEAAGYGLTLVKGTWFACGKESPVRRLVFPLPEEDALGTGIHTSFDTAGRLRFGPDAEVVESPTDRALDPEKTDVFHSELSKYLKGIERQDIYVHSAGIRPRAGKSYQSDFIINEESGRGLPGLINLIGIESPGLTCCLSIAVMVNGLVQEALG
ncbi:MAG: NAD(P)/FAD-dependent oxidoreductase [Thermodesulfovibrionales bacterium]|nr:NAD(P)/FAD-dependent oxidoreductase [Thermodesulfovibrionales bacterium]